MVENVALTALVMKSFEKIAKDVQLNSVQENVDPLQFTYRSVSGWMMQQAVLTLMILTQLEGVKTFVRLVFIDFSSAFNCIQPHMLAECFQNHHISPSLICWLMDFLTARSQCVRVNGVFSDVLSSSTGSPQGCVLSPLLFLLYTNECQSKYAHHHSVKFVDDSVIVSFLNNDDPDHGPVVSDFTDWCKASFLAINVSQTKEMILEQHKYLGTIIDNKLRVSR